MRRAFAIACSLWIAGPALSQTRTGLLNYNNEYINDNAPGAISGDIVNKMITQMVTGMGVLGDTNNWTGANNAFGPWNFIGPVTLPPATIGGTAFQATGTPASRTASARAADTINPRDYGAVGDGASHTAGAALGISTLAGLAAYSADGGVTHPYSFINQYPFGNLFNLNIAQSASIGAGTINFGVTQYEGYTLVSTGAGSGVNVIGAATPNFVTNGSVVSATNVPGGATITNNYNGSIQISANTTGAIAGGALLKIYQPSPMTPAVTSGSTASGTVLPISVAPGLDSRLNGCVVTGTNIPSNDTIVSIGGTSLTLANAISGTVANGATLNIQCSYKVFLQDVTGVSQGDVISGPSQIQAGTQVELVNPSSLEVWLSKPTTGIVAGNASMTFVPYWISHVTAGMQVTSPSLTGSTTVSTVNTATGAVGLAANLTANASPATSFFAAFPVNEGTVFTFWSQYSDAQATALQMDALGFNAAVQGAGPGTVKAEAGTWLIDEPIIFPLNNDPATNTVTLEGSGVGATLFVPYADLGPSNYVLSCGDPSATAANGRGIYANGGTFCGGEWRNFKIKKVGASNYVGARPQWSGVPVAMSGVKQGPRRNMRQVDAEGMNVGVEFQGDWTTWQYATAANNFLGLRLADGMTNLYGDLNFQQVFFGGNAWAGVAISPNTGLIGSHWEKSWIADQPYDIWMEAGVPAGISLEQSDFTNMNFEGSGCGAIKDANVVDDNGMMNAKDFIFNTTIDSSFFSAATNSYTLPGGCVWRAYIAANGIHGLSIRNIPYNAFNWQFGGEGIINTNSTFYFNQMEGGIKLEGGFLNQLFSSYGGVCQEIMGNGTVYSADTSATFGISGSWQGVEFDFGGFGHGRLVPYVDAGGTASLPIGTLLETISSGGNVVAQRAGQASAGTAPLAGAVYGAYTGCNMSGRFVPVITSGAQIPVAVTASPTLGSLLQTDSANPGAAKGAASLTTGISAGQVVNTNGGSTSMVYTRGVLAP